MTTAIDTLPAAPQDLSFGDVLLRPVRIVPGDPSRDLVPYYHFRIVATDGAEVGHINFRVGDTDHIRLFAGHIGYEVDEAYRGHGYSLQACRAIAPFVRSIYPSVTITCDPDNYASMQIIERLGAVFRDEIEVPQHASYDPKRLRRKRRYDWAP